MAAATSDRSTPSRGGERFSRPLPAATRIYAGTIVCLDANGRAVPGSADATLTADGRSYDHVDNRDGADDDLRCDVDKGTFQFANSTGADEITAADIGADCFVVDDQTVAKTSDTDARPVAGRIMDVDAIGVWVRFD